MDAGRTDSRNAGLPAQRTGDSLTGHGIAATVGTGWNQSGSVKYRFADAKFSNSRRIAATQQQKRRSTGSPPGVFVSLIWY